MTHVVKKMCAVHKDDDEKKIKELRLRCGWEHLSKRGIVTRLPLNGFGQCRTEDMKSLHNEHAFVQYKFNSRQDRVLVFHSGGLTSKDHANLLHDLLQNLLKEQNMSKDDVWFLLHYDLQLFKALHDKEIKLTVKAPKDEKLTTRDRQDDILTKCFDSGDSKTTWEDHMKRLNALQAQVDDGFDYVPPASDTQREFGTPQYIHRTNCGYFLNLKCMGDVDRRIAAKKEDAAFPELGDVVICKLELNDAQTLDLTNAGNNCKCEDGPRLERASFANWTVRIRDAPSLLREDPRDYAEKFNEYDNLEVKLSDASKVTLKPLDKSVTKSIESALWKMRFSDTSVYGKVACVPAREIRLSVKFEDTPCKDGKVEVVPHENFLWLRNRKAECILVEDQPVCVKREDIITDDADNTFVLASTLSSGLINLIEQSQSTLSNLSGDTKDRLSSQISAADVENVMKKIVTEVDSNDAYWFAQVHPDNPDNRYVWHYSVNNPEETETEHVYSENRENARKIEKLFPEHGSVHGYAKQKVEVPTKGKGGQKKKEKQPFVWYLFYDPIYPISKTVPPTKNGKYSAGPWLWKSVDPKEENENKAIVAFNQRHKEKKCKILSETTTHYTVQWFVTDSVQPCVAYEKVKIEDLEEADIDDYNKTKGFTPRNCGGEDKHIVGCCYYGNKKWYLIYARDQQGKFKDQFEWQETLPPALSAEKYETRKKKDLGIDDNEFNKRCSTIKRVVALNKNNTANVYWSMVEEGVPLVLDKNIRIALLKNNPDNIELIEEFRNHELYFTLKDKVESEQQSQRKPAGRTQKRTEQLPVYNSDDKIFAFPLYIRAANLLASSSSPPTALKNVNRGWQTVESNDGQKIVFGKGKKITSDNVDLWKGDTKLDPFVHDDNKLVFFRPPPNPNEQSKKSEESEESEEFSWDAYLVNVDDADLKIGFAIEIVDEKEEIVAVSLLSHPARINEDTINALHLVVAAIKKNEISKTNEKLRFMYNGKAYKEESVADIIRYVVAMLGSRSSLDVVCELETGNSDSSYVMDTNPNVSLYVARFCDSTDVEPTGKSIDGKATGKSTEATDGKATGKLTEATDGKAIVDDMEDWVNLL